MKKFLYGIDFGTTNSALAIYDEESKEIHSTIIIPSLIYFYYQYNAANDKNYVVGEEAIKAYLQDGMKGRFIKSVKQILSKTSFTETRIHNRKYNAADLVALILKELKERADELTGLDCRKAVIGRPVFFDDDDVKKDTLAQTRLSKAAEIAGFEEVRFQFEPIGAAFAYEKSLEKKENVLVADLGGGTTDFTYLVLDPEKVGSKDRKNDMMASGGIYIGGDSFDSAFMWEKGTPYFGKHTQYEATPGKVLTVPKSLFANICSWEQMNFFNGLRIKKDIEDYYYFSGNDRLFKNLITLIENNLGYSVFQSIEKTKITLSNTDTTQFSYHNMDIEIEEEIPLPVYEQIIAKDVNRIANYLDQFMLQNGIDPKNIDSLFLTGGTSMVGSIQKLFKNKFPHVNLNSGDNFQSVAKGLAYSGYLFGD
ncbi:putative chaperone protein [Mucilaginibacter frigoritolerans]|uniref:Putative chaperone protein n=1 Tax=Mucilaginibacter frigoritolerans TaxID=652788 RepID=A0A562TML4_9SPHI|nr:Hsp70 family protein [Mucilaginibacter frigoritolerans]TWI94797.1 putative chaperone protein [Mucilaginibacter frigoritolerans]